MESEAASIPGLGEERGDAGRQVWMCALELLGLWVLLSASAYDSSCRLECGALNPAFAPDGLECRGNHLFMV